jgi:hypothetical protein
MPLQSENVSTGMVRSEVAIRYPVRRKVHHPVKPNQWGLITRLVQLLIEGNLGLAFEQRMGRRWKNTFSK